MNSVMKSWNPLPVLSRAASAAIDVIAAPLLRMLSLTSRGQAELVRIAAEGEAVVGNLKSSNDGSAAISSPEKTDYVGLVERLGPSMKESVIAEMLIVLSFPVIWAMMAWIPTVDPAHSEAVGLQNAQAEWHYFAINVSILGFGYAFIRYLCSVRFTKANGFTPGAADEVRYMSRHGHVAISEHGLHVPFTVADSRWTRPDRFTLVPYSGISGLRVKETETGLHAITVYTPVGDIIAKYYPMSPERADRVIAAIRDKAQHITIHVE